MKLHLAAAVLLHHPATAHSPVEPSKRSAVAKTTRRANRKRQQRLFLLSNNNPIRSPRRASASRVKKKAFEHPSASSIHIVADGGGVLKNKKAQGGAEKPAVPECDPGEPDVGILACGLGFYCLESEESPLGGYCTGNESISSSRYLQDDERDGGICDFCDCSVLVDGVGTVEDCIYAKDYCVPLVEDSPIGPEFCGDITVTGIYDEQGIDSVNYCYDAEIPYTRQLCYGYTYDEQGGTESCFLTINGVPCNTCELTTCLDDETEEDHFIFDCSNTIVGTQGNSCNGDSAFPFAKYVADEDTPSPAPDPLTDAPVRALTDLPTLSPFESPPPTSVPTRTPTIERTAIPATGPPTSLPTRVPVIESTEIPETEPPTSIPTRIPTIEPTETLSTEQPTAVPLMLTELPTLTPTTTAVVPPTEAPVRTTDSRTASPVSMTGSPTMLAPAKRSDLPTTAPARIATALPTGHSDMNFTPTDSLTTVPTPGKTPVETDTPTPSPVDISGSSKTMSLICATCLCVSITFACFVAG